MKVKCKIPINSYCWLDTWYDRRTRSWIIQLKDMADNQIGEATYCGHISQIERAQNYMTRTAPVGEDQ